jgi:hypothetical protein
MFWFTQSPGWLGSVVLTSLIALIPIVGSMVLLGWLLEARDNLRRGLPQVPSAGFSYLSRGVAPWVSLIVWGIYAYVPILIVGIIAGGIAAAVAGGGSGAGGIVGLLAGLIELAVVVVLLYLLSSVIGVSDRDGIGAALNPLRIWRTANANSGAAWRWVGAELLMTLILIIPLLLVVGILGISAIYLATAPAQADLDESVA